MKKLTILFNTTFLTILLILFGQRSFSATYTAVASGNWSNSATWGGSGPSDTITNADVIIIPSSTDVVLDTNLVVNNALASLTVTGSLTGNANLNIAEGTLLGGGNVYLNSLTVGIGGFVTSAGSIYVNQLFDSQPLLTLTSTIYVADSLVLYAGLIQLNASSTLNLSNNATITLAGGRIFINGGSLSPNGVYNLLYTDSAATIGLEATYGSLHNITIDLDSAARQIALTGSLAISGTLYVQNGILALDSNSLTINGSIVIEDSGSLSGSTGANIILDGSGNADNLHFTATGDTIHNLILNISDSGSVSLSSQLFVTGNLALNNGKLILDGSVLTVTDSSVVQGGSDSSYVVTNDSSFLVITVRNAGDSAKFHVGTQTHYAPLLVTNNSDSAGAFWVNAHSGVYLYGTSGSDISSTQTVVNTSWNIETALDSATAGINVNIRVFWDSTMQVNGFSDSTAFLAHYTGGAWQRNSPATATAYGNGTFSIALDSVTSFSPFAVFDSSTLTATGIAAVKSDVTILNVYPNPANNYVELGNIQDGGKYNLWLYDVTGQLIEQRESVDNMMNVSSLPAGYYTIAIDQNGNKFRSGLVIAK